MNSDTMPSEEKVMRFALSNYNGFFKNETQRNAFLNLNFVSGPEELKKILMENNYSYFDIYLEPIEERTFTFIAYKPCCNLSASQMMRGGDDHICPIVICNAYKDKGGKIHEPFLMCFDSRAEKYLQEFADKYKSIAKEINIMDYQVDRQYSDSGCIEDTLDVLTTLSVNKELLGNLHDISEELDTRSNPPRYLSFMIPFTERFDSARNAMQSFKTAGELGAIDNDDCEEEDEHKLIHTPDLKLKTIFRNGEFINLTGREILDFVAETGEKRQTSDPAKASDIKPINFEERKANYSGCYEDEMFPYFDIRVESTQLSTSIKTEEDLGSVSYIIDDARDPAKEVKSIVDDFLEEFKEFYKIDSVIKSIAAELTKDRTQVKESESDGISEEDYDEPEKTKVSVKSASESEEEYEFKEETEEEKIEEQEQTNRKRTVIGEQTLGLAVREGLYKAQDLGITARA